MFRQSTVSILVLICLLLMASLSHAQFGSTDVRLFASGNHQTENSIAVNPVNPSNLLVCTNSSLTNRQTYFYSTNGGVNWAGAEGGPGNTAVKGDPVALFDSYGNAYYVTMGKHPDGDTRKGVKIRKSTDGGANWGDPVNADALDEPGIDKPHAAVDLSGTFPNNIYAAWKRSGAGITISRSTNGGGSFQNVVTGSNVGTGLNFGAHLACGPNGEVYGTWNTYPPPGQPNDQENGIAFIKSMDGGANWSSSSLAFGIAGIRTNPDGEPELNNTRARSFPSMKVDISHGPRRGWIYIVYADKSTGNADIYLRRSLDGGANWSSAIRVSSTNPDAIQQWFPSIAVDPIGGAMVVSYFNMDGPNFLTSFWVATSYDGGNTFTRERVSDVTFVPHDINENAYWGDYYEIALYGGKAYPCWSDDRHDEKFQAFISKMTLPIIEATLDQKLFDGTTRVGQLGRYNGSSFSSYNPGDHPLLSTTTPEVLRGDQSLYSGQKYNRWNNDPDVTNHHTFTVDGSTDIYSSNFKSMNGGVVINTDLVDIPGTALGEIQFKDPWLIDFSEYGVLRNQGNSAPFISRGTTFRIDDYPQYNGIFLNQGGPINNWSPPYYSVNAPQTTYGGVPAFLGNWSSPNGLAGFQSATAAQTGIVFTGSGATATARYKLKLGSSNAAASGTTSQRKVVNTYTTSSGHISHAVYESGGSIWYTFNTGSGWSNEVALSISSTAKSPSIGYSTTSGVYLEVVWTDVNPGNPSQWLTYYKKSTSLGLAWDPTPLLLAGAANEPSNPIVCSGFYSAVIWKTSAGLRIMPDPWRTPSWQAFDVYGTDATVREFSATQDISSHLYYDLAFVQGPAGGGQVYHQQIEYGCIPNAMCFGPNVPLSTAYSWMSDCANTSISNNDGQLFVTWDALCESNHRQDEEQGLGQPQRHVLLRAFNTSSWLPVVEFTRYNYPLKKSSVGVNANTGKVVVLWELNGNTIDKTSRDLAGGGWSFTTILDGGASPTIAQHVSSGAFAYAMYTAGSAAPYAIVLNSNVGASPRSGIAAYSEERTQKENDPKQTPQGESNAFRRGAIRLDGLRFGRYERGAVRGDLWIESPTFEFVRGATRQRIPFLSDTSDFGEWLSTSSVNVPTNADLIKGKIQLYIKNFRIVEPRVPMNTTLFSTKIAHGGNGGAEAVKDITLADLERLGAGDTSITIPINIAAQKLRGKSLRVRARMIGQDESEEPAWSTLVVGDSLATGPGSGKFLLAKSESTTATRTPTVFALHQNYPNPFNPATTIKFDLPENSHVSLIVYDVLGRTVVELENDMKDAGYYSSTWNASDAASGVYFARFTATDANGNVKLSKVSKLLLTK